MASPRDNGGHISFNGADTERRARSNSRVVANARLASPIPRSFEQRTLEQRSLSPAAAYEHRLRSPSAARTPLAGKPSDTSRLHGPGTSALADALQKAAASSRSGSPAATIDRGRQLSRNYGTASEGEPYEDFDIVRRHLAGPTGSSPSGGSVFGTPTIASKITPRVSKRHLREAISRDASQAPGIDEEDFSSLRMQGGDVTREIYRRAEAEASLRNKPQRTRSLSVPPVAPIADGEPDVGSINQPGGFRRDHLRRTAHSPQPSVSARTPLLGDTEADSPRQPQFVARNFFEFLSLYGHFAGEDVNDDDDWSDEDTHAGGVHEEDDSNIAANEGTALLKSVQRRKRKEAGTQSKAGAGATILMLLKSFVGTGVLFLPRAFLNAGMVFGVVVMIAVAALSYYCFLLLTTSRLKLKGSFAEMGEMVQGRTLRFLINSSLVISQIGFASAYIVFTATNLSAFVQAVSKCRVDIEIKYMILLQLVVFLPLSLYRNLNNIQFVVYVADLFIVLGLVYLFYFDVATLVKQGGLADIVLFNSDNWTLFIGTAIFTFEGIGLIIPIQDGMQKPSQLPSILALVMVIISVIFVGMGALAYAAFGSKTKTVIILNMPQDNKFVNGVQFIYSLAILLSTPMQIFPAITIMENGIFKRSGKYNKFIKWRKNGFRFGVVMASALIAWLGANDLDKFVALVGSFACIPLVYIYPPIIHYRAVAARKWQKALDAVLVIFGFVLMVYTCTLTISSWVSGSGGGSSKGYCD